MSTSLLDQEIDYPTGDGQPMAETPTHRVNMTDTINRLQEWYSGRDAYVSGNMFVFYEQGNRRRHLSPDVFLVMDVPPHNRDIYCTWRERKPTLDLVIEFTSRTTADEDLLDKMEMYAKLLGVREYLLFDPFEEYLEPSEQLFRLVAGEYEAVQPINGRLPSEVTGLHFERDGQMLVLFDPATKAYVPTTAERERQRADQERLRAEQERQRSSELEAEVARLRAELAALSRPQPTDRSD